MSQATNFNRIGEISMFFQNLLDRAARNMPFRMTLGKLGIRLVTIGRWLQIRYANWNSEFRLRFEEDVKHDGVGWGNFHISDQLILEGIVTFRGPVGQPEKQTDLSREIFRIKGVTDLQFRPYLVLVKKGGVFTWDELRPTIEAAILRHLTKH